MTLIGGGWTAAAAPAVYAAFLGAAARVSHGAPPRIACVIVDEGDGPEYFERFARALTTAGDCHPGPVLLRPGERFDVAALAAVHGLLVCGGPTAAYAAALVPSRHAIHAWLRGTGAPYAGFSAGASIAAERAVVGGWLDRGRPVCPQEASEDLDEVTVAPGLGLVAHSVDVHAAEWGTRPRLEVALASAGAGPLGLAIDEDTVAVFDGTSLAVRGLGTVTTHPAYGASSRSVSPGPKA